MIKRAAARFMSLIRQAAAQFEAGWGTPPMQW